MTAAEIVRRALAAIGRHPPELRKALSKRELERQLRAAGVSRSESVRLASEKFRNG